MAGTSSASCSYYKSRCSLPSAWQTRANGARNQSALNFLKIEGTHVRYVGPGDVDTQAATVRADYPLPADCPLYYFEIKVLDKGQEGYIGIGFCSEEVQLFRLPGWDAHSYGYHGDDGNAFAGSGSGRLYGPTFTTGDVVGALFNKADRSISFFKNGEPLGVAFRDVQEAMPLYPCVGLRTRGEHIVANFGNGLAGESFRTDFTAIRIDFQRRVIASVRKTELPLLSSRGTALLPQLMYDYLKHQRYWRTATVLGRDLLRAEEGHLDEQERQDITVRQQSYDLVAAGRIDDALALLREKYPPELLVDRPALDFRLRVQKFVEMVATAHAAATLDSGQEVTAATSYVVPSAGPGSSDSQEKADAVASSCGTMNSAAAPDSAVAPMAASPMDTAWIGSSCVARDDSELRAEASVRLTESGVAAATADEDGAKGPTGKAAATSVPTTLDILSYGNMELWPLCRTSADMDLLTEALSLLVFADPVVSPAGDMLRPAYRVALAEELNGAMLACRGKPATSPLERLYQQLSAVVAQLRQLDHPQALLLSEPRQLVMEGSTEVAGTEETSGGGGALDLMTA